MRLLILFFLICLLNILKASAIEKASAALNAGLFKEALKHITIAQKEDSKNADVYRMKALLHEALDEPQKALKSWEACLEYSKNKNIRLEAKIHIKNLSVE